MSKLCIITSRGRRRQSVHGEALEELARARFRPATCPEGTCIRGELPASWGDLAGGGFDLELTQPLTANSRASYNSRTSYGSRICSPMALRSRISSESSCGCDSWAGHPFAVPVRPHRMRPTSVPQLNMATVRMGYDFEDDDDDSLAGFPETSPPLGFGAAPAGVPPLNLGGAALGCTLTPGSSVEGSAAGAAYRHDASWGATSPSINGCSPLGARASTSAATSATIEASSISPLSPGSFACAKEVSWHAGSPARPRSTAAASKAAAGAVRRFGAASALEDAFPPTSVVHKKLPPLKGTRSEPALVATETPAASRIQFKPLLGTAAQKAQTRIGFYPDSLLPPLIHHHHHFHMHYHIVGAASSGARKLIV
eukprot:TRINITY_DN3025_c1_g3_i2.p1 TRINITY_DN3025_c1_g3~~TRINITY_DN3025_c1_g3_i2.p1  ORF type:complete len:370 (+),score=50.46 TRINITY_DN3025_c1_g3_i2:282-1391(+)